MVLRPALSEGLPFSRVCGGHMSTSAPVEPCFPAARMREAELCIKEKQHKNRMYPIYEMSITQEDYKMRYKYKKAFIFFKNVTLLKC